MMLRYDSGTEHRTGTDLGNVFEWDGNEDGPQERNLASNIDFVFIRLYLILKDMEVDRISPLF